MGFEGAAEHFVFFGGDEVEDEGLDPGVADKGVGEGGDDDVAVSGGEGAEVVVDEDAGAGSLGFGRPADGG